MANSYFQFKQFRVEQGACAMKVTTDGCLFGAWVASEIAAAEAPPVRMLDIGCGTGLLSLMVAQKCSARTDAVEIDAAAAAQARQNVQASPWNNNIAVMNGDIFKIDTDHYDCIFSNPPFYENDLKSGLAAKNLAHHNTGMSLAALMAFISVALAAGGAFYLLIPYKRLVETQAMIEAEGLRIYQQVEVKQSTGHGPFRVMISGGRRSVLETNTTLSIKNADAEYTAEFIALLTDYYLYL